MKLLFDQNLAPGLARTLADLFPGSAHVIRLGLDAVDDHTLWTYAAAHTFMIVSKDSDFADLAAVHR